MLQLAPQLLSSGMAISLATLALRISGGLPMMLHGAPKLFGSKRKQMREMMSKQGFPGPFFDAIGILEFLGGIFLAIGFLTTLASGLLTLQMIGTTILHFSRSRRSPESSKFTGGYEVTVLFLGISLAVFILGPGIFSLDYVV